MPTRNINLTPEMDKFVASRIRRGQYANASEVLRAGLRALEQDEQEAAAKIEALRSAIQAGVDSGVAKGDPIKRLRQRIKRHASLSKISA